MFTTSLNAIVRNKHFLVNNIITVISILPSLNQVCYVRSFFENHPCIIPCLIGSIKKQHEMNM